MGYFYFCYSATFLIFIFELISKANYSEEINELNTNDIVLVFLTLMYHAMSICNWLLALVFDHE